MDRVGNRKLKRKCFTSSQGVCTEGRERKLREKMKLHVIVLNIKPCPCASTYLLALSTFLVYVRSFKRQI